MKRPTKETKLREIEEYIKAQERKTGINKFFFLILAVLFLVVLIDKTIRQEYTITITMVCIICLYMIADRNGAKEENKMKTEKDNSKKCSACGSTEIEFGYNNLMDRKVKECLNCGKVETK